jgi:N-acetylmuramoyl-L-alanine amidase
MKTIAVTAGHSETDPGAVANGTKESTLTVQLRDQVAAKLRAMPNITVLTDGAVGRNQPLVEAIKLARRANGFAVEFHMNAAENRNATGIEALAPANQRAHAKALCKVVHQVTGLPLRGGDGGYKPSNAGQHSKLGFCEAGGIVVEPGFISNTNDLRLIRDNMDQLTTMLAEEIASW